MRVYILTSEDDDGVYDEGVFSSFSALETWLINKYNYSSEIFEEVSTEVVYFKDKLFGGYTLYYRVHDLIGEHCPRTGCLKLD